MDANSNPNLEPETGKLKYLDNQATAGEYDYAETAIEEEETAGSTDKRCWRCGKPYLLHLAGNSYTITCETAYCFQAIVRGI